MAKKKSTQQQLVDVTKEIQSIHAKLQELSQEASIEPSAESDPTELKSRQQQDLAWLIGRPDIVQRYQGNYVVVHNQCIIASSPIEALVRISAADQINMKREEVLVIPLNVIGSEDLWEEIQAMLVS